MVNNFNNEGLKKVMDNSDRDFYYSGFITKRDKDFIEGEIDNKHQREIVYYNFKNHDELLSYEEDIVGICNSLNARFYLYPRKISYRSVMFALQRTMINAAEINQENNVIKNINSILKYERPNNIKFPEAFTLLDYDKKDNVNEFRSELFNLLGENLLLDMPTVYGHHFLLTNAGEIELEVISKMETELMDIKPDAALLIYYNDDSDE